jgi:hypothetical protein
LKAAVFLKKKIGQQTWKTQKASTKVASDQVVIDPKYDTCTKRDVHQAHKKNLTHHMHRQVRLRVCPQINAAEMIGLQSRNVFVSVMLPG